MTRRAWEGISSHSARHEATLACAQARNYPVLCLVLSCPVLSCLVPVLSCPLYSVLSCPVPSCPVLSCPVPSCPVLCHLSCPLPRPRIEVRGDAWAWRGLHAMEVHYKTQPVPNPLSAWLHRRPAAFHRFEVR